MKQIRPMLLHSSTFLLPTFYLFHPIIINMLLIYILDTIINKNVSLLRNSPSIREPKDSSRAHNSPPLVYSTSQMNSVHSLTHILFKINFNIFVPIIPTSPKQSLPFRYFRRTICSLGIYHLCHACYMPCQFHPHLISSP
jgi:hypothetical protein